MKEVNYDKYCPFCKHVKCEEADDPCYKCLEEPVREETAKPLYFEEK